MATTTHLTTSATFASTAITSLVDSSISEESQAETQARSDASVYVEGVYLDGMSYVVTVTTTDAAFTDQWSLGTTGSLVVERKERAAGKGTSATTITSTFANSVLTSVSDTAADNGEAAVTLTFRAYSSDGSTDPRVVS